MRANFGLSAVRHQKQLLKKEQKSNNKKKGAM
jgi:hypothetical protein